MADRTPHRLPQVPSTITGDLYGWLDKLRIAFDAIPSISYVSFSGGPNSNLTGLTGDIAVNLVTSAETARLYVKAVGSGNTGWRSFVTI